MPRRSVIFGFGPIGCVLLVPLMALIWIAAVGYNLQHQLLRLVDALFGWEGVYYFVTRILVGHFFSLQLPTFGLIAFCVVILPLHFAPRPPARWSYALLLVWALLAPALPWTLLASRPAGMNIDLWWFLTEASGTLGTAAILAIVTRSWGLGAAVCVIGGAAFGVVTLGQQLGPPSAVATPGLIASELIAFYGWHLALLAAVTWWVAREWRRRRPEYLCQSCAYDLRGLRAAVCPECGAAVATPESLRAPPGAPTPRPSPAPAAP